MRNVQEIIAEVARVVRRPKRQVAPIVRAAMKAIPTGIERNGEVCIYGVGRFSIKKTRPITLNDRWSGEQIKVPPQDAVRFVPGVETVRAVKRRNKR